MSVVKYGAEALKMCKVNSWDMKAVFSEDGIDYLYHEHRVNVTAMIAADLEANEPLDTIIARIRQNLGCPRQPFALYLGNDATNDLVPPDHGTRNDPPYTRWGHDGEQHGRSDSDQWDGVIDTGINTDDPITGSESFKIHSIAEGKEIQSRSVLVVDAPDIAGGPKAEVVSITELEGTRFAYLNCNFIANQSHCATPPAVLSNRWEVRHGLTQNRMTVMTFTGICIVNPARVVNADRAREIVIPPLPAGFLPVRADFNLSSDGRTLRYTIVYEEKYQLPPGPFIQIEASVGNSTSTGGVTQSEIRISGEAPKTVSKALMLQRMSQILLSRFNFATDKLTGANTDESMFETDCR
jgi:hypothetical protein